MVNKQINKYMYIMYIEMPLIIICILYVYIYIQYIGGWVAKPNCRALGHRTSNFVGKRRQDR